MYGRFRRRARFVYAVLAVILAERPSVASSAGSLERIRNLVDNGSVMLNDENGGPVIALNSDAPFIPASIIKVPGCMFP